MGGRTSSRTPAGSVRDFIYHLHAETSPSICHNIQTASPGPGVSERVPVVNENESVTGSFLACLLDNRKLRVSTSLKWLFLIKQQQLFTVTVN